MTKEQKPSHRVVPLEFEKMPHNKQELASKIAAQRKRLIAEKGLVRSTEEALEKKAWLASKNSFPKSAILRYATQNPMGVAVIGVGALIALPLLFRRFGTRRVFKGVGVISPLMLNLLDGENKSHLKKTLYENFTPPSQSEDEA